MGPISIFMLAMLCVSSVIYCLGSALRLLDKRLEQWPLFWAMSLTLCSLVPLLGIGILQLPNSVSPDALAVFSLHEPLSSLGFMAQTTADPIATSNSSNLGIVRKSLVAIYLVGLFFGLAKLAFGRFRINQIILKADCADIAGQDDVLVSDAISSPFAWTPFGRVRDSRILMPACYRGVVSPENLLDILLHERAHISRRDDECGLILRVMLCVCWFSPFAHVLFARWSQSTELRCDMTVTEGRSPEMRRAYAETLLQALHIVAGRVVHYPAASFSTQRIRNEKMRIKHIMTGAQPTFKRRRDSLLLSLGASAIAVMGMMTISATAAADPAPEKASKNYVSNVMVSGRLTSKFGEVPDPFKKGKTRNHRGVDIAGPVGTPIYAPAEGVILQATDSYNGNPKYGNVVVIETAGGIKTMFAHLDGFLVQPGQQVAKGAQIATMGSSGQSTGSHVHIETFRDWRPIDPATIWEIDTK